MGKVGLIILILFNLIMLFVHFKTIRKQHKNGEFEFMNICRNDETFEELTEEQNNKKNRA